MKRTLCITSIIMVLLFFPIFLAGSASSEMPEDVGVSPCKITRDMVDQTVSVFGRIVFITHDDPDGIFADVVALSGVGSSALHLDFPEVSMLSTRLADQSIVYMTENMSAS